MSNSTTINKPTRLDAKTSIAAMRRALKDAFPSVKFSVRMSRGTAYGNAGVSWTDGPLTEEVQAVTRLYRTEGFDGMTDSTLHYDREIEWRGQTYLSGVGLVLTHHDFSEAAVAGAVERLKGEGYRGHGLECAARAVLRGCSFAVAADHHHLSR